MSFYITIPTANSIEETITIEANNPIVIIGANDSGKSRLGHWIEYNQNEKYFTHRISAQRSLEMSEEIWATHYKEAEKDLFFGSTAKRQRKKDPKYGRWHERPTTSTLLDYDEVVSLLFAYESKRNSQYVEKSKKSRKKAPIPPSRLDKLIGVWNKVLPHRKIELDDNRVVAIAERADPYSAAEMSDGERVAFYLIGHCLCAPENSILIIDEPEIHIHRSLQSAIWDEMESIRDDCCFIYLTHELEFAASRLLANKIWLKSFDGTVWDWEFIPDFSNIDEDILLEILGSRKPVLFVEGEKGNLDHKLYQIIFPNYLVIPRGGCTNVIDSVKALNDLSNLHHLKIHGLIDRDFREITELSKLEKQNIHPIGVAEIENLFCVPELVKYVAKEQLLNPDSVFEEVKKYIIKAFNDELDSQVSKKASGIIKYKLNSFNDKSVGMKKFKINICHWLIK